MIWLHSIAVVRPAESLPQDLILTCALLFGALVGTWLLYAHFVATVETATTAPALTFAERFPAQERSLIPYSPLINPRVSYGPAVAFSQSAPLAADFVLATAAPVAASMQIAQQDADPSRVAEVPAPPAPVIPMPRARPAELALLTDPAPSRSGLTTTDKDATPQAQTTPAQARIASAVTAAAEKRSVIQKLLGIGGKSPAETALAYAASDGGITDAQSGHSLPYDRWTAVYDIAARTVYMPDGRKLEAHSGLGSKLDDPRFVSVHNLGATPPNVYDLKLREQSFHGVRALRLTPTGDGETYNRAGLLAHSFMLGPRGNSNGCVSFRDYDAFLRAFENGEVKRLVVVSKLS